MLFGNPMPDYNEIEAIITVIGKIKTIPAGSLTSLVLPLIIPNTSMCTYQQHCWAASSYRKFNIHHLLRLVKMFHFPHWLAEDKQLCIIGPNGFLLFF